MGKIDHSTSKVSPLRSPSIILRAFSLFPLANWMQQMKKKKTKQNPRRFRKKLDCVAPCQNSVVRNNSHCVKMAMSLPLINASALPLVHSLCSYNTNLWPESPRAVGKGEQSLKGAARRQCDIRKSTGLELEEMGSHSHSWSKCVNSTDCCYSQGVFPCEMGIMRDDIYKRIWSWCLINLKTLQKCSKSLAEPGTSLVVQCLRTCVCQCWSLQATTKRSVLGNRRSCMMQWRSCVSQLRPNEAK